VAIPSSTFTLKKSLADRRFPPPWSAEETFQHLPLALAIAEHPACLEWKPLPPTSRLSQKLNGVTVVELYEVPKQQA
jgi:hypothetical protein